MAYPTRNRDAHTIVKTRLEHSNAHPSDFRGMRILVMGLGLHGGGVETVKFFARRGARITVTDLRDKKTLRPSLNALRSYRNITYILGKHRAQDIEASDIILKNPGVPPDSTFLKLARARGIPIKTDVGIFFAACPATIIGITGTRGKSTAAYLLWRFLRERHTRARIFLGGNIRRPVLTFLDRVKSTDMVVLELSSFQLEDLASQRQSPPIAVVTNILRDHLNRHGSLRAYTLAKRSIFQFQKPNDYLFINKDDPRVRSLAKTAPGHVEAPLLRKPLIPLIDQQLGKHYRATVTLAIGVARHFGVPFSAIQKVLQKFHGLPGRQETIGFRGGVRFVNDTTATIPDAAIAALERFSALAAARGGRLIVIAGGQDKMLRFKTFARALKQYAHALVLLPGTATDQLDSLLRTQARALIRSAANSMQQAVAQARRYANPSDIILLSPGAASFGLFQNEFDRGDQFVRAVRGLKNSRPPHLKTMQSPKPNRPKNKKSS